MASWNEWEGQGIEGSFIFVAPQWYEDSPTERALLAHAIREIGITAIPNSAHIMAGQAEFHLSWFGYLDGEIFPDVCDELGYTADGYEVDTPRKCTFAVLAGQPASL